MADNLTDVMRREQNLTNNNSSTRPSSLSRLLSRKILDNNSSNHQHQKSIDYYNDVLSLNPLRTSKSLYNGINLDTSYDTDGAVARSRNISKHHFHNSDNYEFLVSPRLPVRRSLKNSSKQVPIGSFQQRLSDKVRLTTDSSLDNTQRDYDRDEDLNYDNDRRRRHSHPNRRVHQSSIPSENDEVHDVHLAVLPQPVRSFSAIPSVKPLRIIFIRHGERANQALGSDWFNKAFRTHTYKAYDPNLPFILPKRRFNQAYEFDVPLTVHGLQTARLTGHILMNNKLVADICLSSTALRCIQTCERILTGMERRDRIPIRIEPGLFECPHFNHKIVNSFMTQKELMENRYNIKHEYKPIISKVTVPETLDEYFERSATVMREIIDRYSIYGGTILIVTHAPGLLALTSAIKGLRPNTETFYRTVSTYPPLAIYLAEYDGSRWKYSDQPFNVISNE
ncbi:unnamed protein product [Rotaria sordida]|uniref:Uncharacterized protein n=1 Tax=Rotaria sordida TaxID=392033 RepID=A0A814IK06_9BILA|nr:unnamed protein product [Rotaria sordida]CAF3722842.1 unnamed protein product [Rotaria sordida]